MSEWGGALEIVPQVAEALAGRTPIVLFESAVLSHGLPADVALHTVDDMTRDVAEAGALAATVAVLDGRIIVGVPPHDLPRLTRGGVVKIAERDLPAAVALGHTGGTTVSATIAVADLVGVPVVATGGIGGVHLGADRSWDVSADLPALAAHPVAVVCAGAKAICDIPKTLEFLETAGVTVVGFQTDRFPFFLAVDSGSPVPRRIETPAQVAALMRAKRALMQRGGLVLANPIPAPAGLDRVVVMQAVAAAQREADRAGASGSDLTPFLLAALASITQGASLRANAALLRANARLAARVAGAIAATGQEGSARYGS